MNLHLMFWNAQGLSNEGSQRHLRNLVHLHRIKFLGVVEPMSSNPDVDRLANRIGLRLMARNLTNKIWFFSESQAVVSVLRDHEQALLIKVEDRQYTCPLIITIVYAKCTRQERVAL